MNYKNNLQDKINLLYEFVYTNNNFNSKIYGVNLNNISMDDIKFSKNDNELYNNLIYEILVEI